MAIRDADTKLEAGRAYRTDDIDISLTPNSARHLDKVAFSAQYGLQREQLTKPEEQRIKDKSERDQRTARMMAWDAQKTLVAGVEMTNAQAQEARRRIVEDADRYSRWAVERGYIAAGEEVEFEDAAQRMYALKEMERGNGELTPAQQAEWDALQASRSGRAVDQVTADVHTAMQYGVRPDAAANARAAKEDSPFPTAPDMGASFRAAVNGPQQPAPSPAGIEPTPVQPASAPVLRF